MSNTDAGSSNVIELLWLNSGVSANGDSGNVLMRTGAWSSSAGGSVTVKVDFEDNRAGGY